MAKYIRKRNEPRGRRGESDGKAKYAGEFTAPNIAYGFIVSGEIAKGTIKAIDAGAAENRRE